MLIALLTAKPRRKLTAAKRRTRRTLVGAERRHERARRQLAARYLRGDGIEIGALHMPLRVPAEARVRYVDRLTVPELREHYPELAEWDLVDPDLIENGETLAGIPDLSVDFVIACHMIEHCEDPIGTLSAHVRVLRPGGILFMAVPDGRLTFDRDREPTSIAHVRRDHDQGPAWSRRGHYEEWARYIDRLPEEEIPAAADQLERNRYSIHFHVWTPTAFIELLVGCRALGMPLEIEALRRNDHEFLVVLSRAHGASTHH